MWKAVSQVLFSSGMQNPKFTAEESKGSDYEVRTYHPSNWMSTVTTGQHDAAMSAGFKRLFSYIRGNNHTKEKVEMTAPVSGLIEAGASETKVTMSFYMPEKHQDAQPQPIDPEVFLEKRKEFTVFVRTYGGFSNEQKSSEELRKLLESLQRDEQRYKDAPYYVAGYDSPFKLTNRKNEVWVLKKGDQEE